MTERLMTWVRRRPVLAFYVLALILTWLGWIPQAAYSYGRFPFDSPVFYVLGGVGPLLAALAVAHVLYGQRDGEELFKPLLRWRVGIIWYLVALFGGVAIMLASMSLAGATSQGLARITPSFGLLLLFLRYLFAAIPEEVAWRGFVLPRLQAHYSALTSSLIVGIMWALWHLPLLLTKGSVMATYPRIPYFIGVVASSVLYTWLYNSSGGSVLLVTIFHAVSNAVGPSAGLVQTLVLLLVAAVLVARYGPAHLSGRQARTVQGARANVPDR